MDQTQKRKQKTKKKMGLYLSDSMSGIFQVESLTFRGANIIDQPQTRAGRGL